jgi:homoserine dehydrogenase
MSPARLDLVLVGFGNVGRRFVRLLRERAAHLLSTDDLTWRVIGIVTRRHGAASDLDGLDVDEALSLAESGRPLDLLRDVGANPAGLGETRTTNTFIDQTLADALRADPARHLVMVETSVLDIGSGQPAISHVRTALLNRAHVITANKGPVAFAYRELAALAHAQDLSFLFEGAVMDGIPVFNLARETMPAITITGFRGVVNTTTNFILAAMQDGREFAEALAEMQAAGIAEADASLDVAGWDAAAKTAALVNVLMDGAITPRDVDRTGIGGLNGSDLRAAAARGRAWKLVATAGYRDGRLSRARRAGGTPLRRPAGPPRSRAERHHPGDGPARSLRYRAARSGHNTTAYALVSDLVTIRRRLMSRRQGSGPEGGVVS